MIWIYQADLNEINIVCVYDDGLDKVIHSNVFLIRIVAQFSIRDPVRSADRRCFFQIVFSFLFHYGYVSNAVSSDVHSLPLFFDYSIYFHFQSHFVQLFCTLIYCFVVFVFFFFFFTFICFLIFFAFIYLFFLYCHIFSTASVFIFGDFQKADILNADFELGEQSRIGSRGDYGTQLGKLLKLVIFLFVSWEKCVL